MLFYFMYTAVKSSRATVAHIKVRAVKFTEKARVRIERDGLFMLATLRGPLGLKLFSTGSIYFIFCSTCCFSSKFTS